MRDLFLEDFAALKAPALNMDEMRAASLDELKEMRLKAETVEYKSPEAMEPVILEYVKAERVWRNFMERAITFNFEEIFRDMISILHFVNDVRGYRERNPGRLFIHEALVHPRMKATVYEIVGGGIRRFLDYAIELKERQPEMFEEVMEDYALSSRIRKAGDAPGPACD
jgi:hypothetical protein